MSYDLNNPLSDVSFIDTHNHFDFAEFDHDRLQQAEFAHRCGVRHLVMAGYIAQYFDRLLYVQDQLDQHFLTLPVISPPLQAHVALGLHPCFIDQHLEEHLYQLERYINDYTIIAIGEIGLDTFAMPMKSSQAIHTQRYFFIKQLDLAVKYMLPVILHIRKAHAEVLAILKQHSYDAHQQGGVAHSFSGGMQEALAFTNLGFKLGVTAQICNPHAKKLRRAILSVVEKHGIGCLVIETDCPDMPPLHSIDTRNIPANVRAVCHGLSELLHVNIDTLAKQLWFNSYSALKL